MTSLFQVRSECPLGQLLAREAALGREIRALDSDMQTLLYENYNKFISATGGLSGRTQAFGGRPVGSQVAQGPMGLIFFPPPRHYPKDEG